MVKQEFKFYCAKHHYRHNDLNNSQTIRPNDLHDRHWETKNEIFRLNIINAIVKKEAVLVVTSIFRIAVFVDLHICFPAHRLSLALSAFKIRLQDPEKLTTYYGNMNLKCRKCHLNIFTKINEAKKKKGLTVIIIQINNNTHIIQICP